MPIVTEDFYEQHALGVFEEIGYEVLRGPDIAPDGLVSLYLGVNSCSVPSPS